MKNNKQNSAVPKLRFPEFANRGEWYISLFKDIYTTLPTNSYSRIDLNNHSGKVKNIHYDYIHKYFDTILDVKNNTIPYINENINLSNINNNCYCQDGDIVFADASEDLEGVGKCIEIINTKNMKILSGMHTILARQQGMTFIIGISGYLFQSSIIKKQIQKESQGTKVFGISSNRLSSTKIYYPHLHKEQQKIADCLSSVDTLINTEEEKLQKYKEYKKGLLQKLFPAKGKLTPEYRFSEFANSGEWSSNLITKISQTSIGLVTTKTKYYVKKGVKLIRNSDIIQNRIKKSNLIHLDISFAEVNKNRKLQQYDIVTVHTGNIGTSCVIDEDMIGSIGFATLNTRPNLNLIDPYYLCWYYNSPVNMQYAMSIATGDGRSNYNLKDFDNAKIPIPPTIGEQKKIADCLTSLDELIELQTQKITALKQHKKGLMQQLFPEV